MKNYEGRNIKDEFAATLMERYCERFSFDEADAKVLDYGPASGVFQAQLARRGFRNLYGADLKDYRDEEAKPLFCDFKIADISYDRLEWPDNYFDVITAWCIFPHLENPHHAVRETLRLLKPGGLLLLSIPHLGSRASIRYFLEHKDFARYHPEKNHIFVFTPGIFHNTVARHFDIVGQEFLIDPRSVRGWKGKIRGAILKYAKKHPRIKNFFENLWGYNQIWILKKKLSNSNNSNKYSNDSNENISSNLS